VTGATEKNSIYEITYEAMMEQIEIIITWAHSIKKELMEAILTWAQSITTEQIKTVQTWALNIAQILGGFAAGYLLEKWRNNQKHKHGERLADFLTEAQQLQKRINEVPLPIKEHNDWVDSVNEYLHKNLSKTYEVRFNDFSGMTFYAVGSLSENQNKMSRSLDGRSRRLNEFMSELSG